uniref:AlNc14C343G10823 protein n=1 Tax=Albugo laibachii Nc14 TaxID=890382 RepID=F0WX64_9STRA|nr:AlNc14C343G10823 [Albugo laibachii Nc14]|eukprot:CCA26055.1 AlNc14C343G10823 [Albugo laibachii Nc14]
MRRLGQKNAIKNIDNSKPKNDAVDDEESRRWLRLARGSQRSSPASPNPHESSHRNKKKLEEMTRLLAENTTEVEDANSKISELQAKVDELEKRLEFNEEKYFSVLEQVSALVRETWDVERKLTALEAQSLRNKANFNQISIKADGIQTLGTGCEDACSSYSADTGSSRNIKQVLDDTHQFSDSGHRLSDVSENQPSYSAYQLHASAHQLSDPLTNSAQHISISKNQLSITAQQLSDSTQHISDPALQVPNATYELSDPKLDRSHYANQDSEFWTKIMEDLELSFNTFIHPHNCASGYGSSCDYKYTRKARIEEEDTHHDHELPDTRIEGPHYASQDDSSSDEDAGEFWIKVMEDLDLSSTSTDRPHFVKGDELSSDIKKSSKSVEPK